MAEPAQSITIDGAGREEVCPYFHRAVELLGKRWTGAIVDALLRGPRRFSEIAQSIPQISDRLLSARLRELEAEGIVARHVKTAVPVRVQYGLTAKGEALEPAVRALRQWAREWDDAPRSYGPLDAPPAQRARGERFKLSSPVRLSD
jgi:DNA-binding HxlR family transcriptional regulator